MEPNDTVTIEVSQGRPIPAVGNRREGEAAAVLRGQGFTVWHVQRQQNPRISEGTAIKTIPGEGEALPRGAELTLFVSSGPPPLPDVTGLSSDAATGALAAYNVTILFEPSSQVARDSATRTDPASDGTRALPGGAEITLSPAVRPIQSSPNWPGSHSMRRSRS